MKELEEEKLFAVFFQRGPFLTQITASSREALEQKVQEAEAKYRKTESETTQELEFIEQRARSLLTDEEREAIDGDCEFTMVGIADVIDWLSGMIADEDTAIVSHDSVMAEVTIKFLKRGGYYDCL